GRRDPEPGAGRAGARAGPDRLRRGAVDGGHLHARRRQPGHRQGRAGGGPAVRLRRAGQGRRPAGRSGREHRPLSEDAGRRRGPGAEDLRKLGRGPAGGPVPSAGAGAASPAGRPGARVGRDRPADRLPTRLGGAGGRLCRRHSGPGRGAGHRLSAGDRPSGAGEAAHPGGARSAAAARRRGGAGPAGGRADGRLGPGAVDLQPRPRDPAGHAHPARRAGAQADRRRMTGRRIAVVLFNLGGPDRQEDVKPFLFNLFNDPAIIGLPGLVRTPLARRIASRREAEAQANYALMGGGSPLLAETRKQADALQARLADRLPEAEVRTFIAMRYWTPLVAHAAAEVAAFAPDELVLLPLYPQFSTTTTASSVREW